MRIISGDHECGVCFEEVGDAPSYGHVSVFSKDYRPGMQVFYEPYVRGNNKLTHIMHRRCFETWIYTRAPGVIQRCVNCQLNIAFSEETIQASESDRASRKLILWCCPERLTARERACMGLAKRAAYYTQNTPVVHIITFYMIYILGDLFKQSVNAVKVSQYFDFKILSVDVEERICYQLIELCRLLFFLIGIRFFHQGGVQRISSFVERNVLLISDHVSWRLAKVGSRLIRHKSE